MTLYPNVKQKLKLEGFHNGTLPWAFFELPQEDEVASPTAQQNPI